MALGSRNSVVGIASVLDVAVDVVLDDVVDIGTSVLVDRVGVIESVVVDGVDVTASVLDDDVGVVELVGRAKGNASTNSNMASMEDDSVVEGSMSRSKKTIQTVLTKRGFPKILNIGTAFWVFPYVCTSYMTS